MKRGRPRKPPEERLTELVVLRVTPAEADALYREALRRGEPLSTLLREWIPVLPKIAPAMAGPTLGASE